MLTGWLLIILFCFISNKEIEKVINHNFNIKKDKQTQIKKRKL